MCLYCTPSVLFLTQSSRFRLIHCGAYSFDMPCVCTIFDLFLKQQFQSHINYFRPDTLLLCYQWSYFRCTCNRIDFAGTNLDLTHPSLLILCCQFFYYYCNSSDSTQLYPDSIDMTYFWASTRKKGIYGFAVYDYSNPHEQSSIWVTNMCFFFVVFFLFFFCLKIPKVSTTCLRTAKALARLRLCAGSPEPLLVADVISTLFLALL